MAAAAQNLSVPGASQGKTVFFQVHAVQGRKPFQADCIGTLLVKLEKEQTVLIEKWEVGSHNCLGKVDFPIFGNGKMGHQLKDRGVFIDGQIRGKPGQEFQWMKLGLVREADTPCGGKGQGKLLPENRGIPQLVQCGKLRFQLLHAGTGINRVVRTGKITVNFSCQGCERGNCGKISL